MRRAVLLLSLLILTACSSGPQITIDSPKEPRVAVQMLSEHYDAMYIDRTDAVRTMRTDWMFRDSEHTEGWILPDRRREKEQLTIEISPHELNGSWIRVWVDFEIEQARGSLGRRWQPIDAPVERLVEISQEIQRALEANSGN
ncbi:MAG: hypothetical protein RL885_03665 [Planctomycetota bacterium]